MLKALQNLEVNAGHDAVVVGQGHEPRELELCLNLFLFEAVRLTGGQGRRPKGTPEIERITLLTFVLGLLPADGRTQVWHLGGIPRNHFKTLFRVHRVAVQRHAGMEVLANGAVVPEKLDFRRCHMESS